MNVRKFCITKLVWMTLLLCVLFSSIGTISASAAELEKVDKSLRKESKVVQTKKQY